MNKSSTPGHLSASECNEALEGFVVEAEQLQRLHLIARRYAGTDLEAEDLVQDAFTRILNCDRAWPRGLAVMPFLIKVLQSIASEVREKRKRWKPHMVATGDPPVPTPAELLEAFQEDQSKLKHFEDDPELHVLAEGLLQGWRKPELLPLFDHDELKYQTTRTRLRRRMKELNAALSQIGGPHDQDHAREADDR